MTKQEASRIRQEYRAYRQRVRTGEDFGPNLKDVNWLMNQWRENSPKMVQELAAHNLVRLYAIVQLEKAFNAKMAYLRQGMPPPDARNLAEREHLLLTPESVEEEERAEQEAMEWERENPTAARLWGNPL